MLFKKFVEQVVITLIQQRKSRYVDVDLLQLPAVLGVFGQPLAQGIQRPAINCRQKTIAFGGYQKLPGGKSFVGRRIAVAQEKFMVPALFLPLQRPHRLEEQFEVVQLDGFAQARNPLQLALVFQ